jgi:hypothetical protein
MQMRKRDKNNNPAQAASDDSKPDEFLVLLEQVLAETAVEGYQRRLRRGDISPLRPRRPSKYEIN